MIALLFALMSASSGKQIIRGNEAYVRYVQMSDFRQSSPDQVGLTETQYFADWERPELGRLWLTTLYTRTSPPQYCYEYDFRETKVKEYLCELNDAP